MGDIAAHTGDMAKRTGNDVALDTYRFLRGGMVVMAVLLGAVHFVMQAKGWPLEPLVYLGLVLGLLGLRPVPKTRSQPAPGM